MRFEINMRDRTGYEIEASYIEVTDGPVSSSFTLVGFVPGYPSAILAAFPVDMVESVLPALPAVALSNRRTTRPRPEGGLFGVEQM